MIRLGLRLTFHGGREAAVRLVVTAAAVALGAGLLLAALAGINALIAQSPHESWFNSTGVTAGSPPVSPGTPAAGTEWWLTSYDQFGSQTIYRIDVAAAGPGAPVPPGLTRLPGPGQFSASPAMSALLRRTPAGELADRFPGRQAGTIGDAGLPGPDTLIIVVGHTAGQLARVPGAVRVSDIASGPGYSTAAFAAVLGIVALALLFPVLVFIGTATRLAAARREQRFAAMRLAGGTPRQVSAIASVEALAAAIAGTAGGFGLFFLFRRSLAGVPFMGQPFFPSEVTLSPAAIVVVALGVPAASAVAARRALRRVRISPLGVSRQATSPRPRSWRVAPLLAGIGELGYFAAAGHPATIDGQLWAYLAGGALVVTGLVIAGPWLTMAASAALSRRARRAAALLAARRIADQPGAAFRTISGLILAVFVATVAVTIITSTLTARAAGIGGATGSNVLVEDINGPHAAGGSPAGAVIRSSLVARLRSIPGVTEVAVGHVDPLAAADHWLIGCAQLARLPVLGRCRAGAAVAAIGPGTRLRGGPVWPAAPVSPGRLAGLPARWIIVGTNGSAAAIERARTLIEVAFPLRGTPATIHERGSYRLLMQWQQLSEVVILASLPIAGCSLAVSVTGGLTDRKRPFSLLRLTGVPMSMLRRVVLLETGVPLLLVALVSAGAGMLTATLFLRSQLGLTPLPPGPGYYAVTGGGLALSLAIIVATFPLLGRITGPGSARNE